ncbi:MAG: DsbE family thiol:disulfide interchange protein [Burkholderiaceae bacterium]|nr:DsbE family thiol:disulfide interchange protein [Burkholderiaceae bacterium]
MTRRTLLFLLPLGAFAVLAGFLLRGLWLNPREVPSPLIGKPAPAFERATLDSARTFSPTDLRGQVWVLNVWASWCAPCRDEHPVWNAFAREGLAPLVGLNYKDDPANASRFLRDLGNPYLVTVVDRDGAIGIEYGVYGVRETFVIDRAGVIRYKHIGPVTPEVMQRKILPLLQQLQKS